MKELSKQTSTLLFILLTGVLVVIAFISYNKIRQFNKSVDWVMHTHVVKDNIVELRSNIKDAESGQRGYLMTNDSVFLQPFIGAEQRSNLVFATLDSLISDNTEQQENLKKLKTLVDERYLFLNKKLKLFKNNQSTNLPADSLLLESKNKMDEVRKQIALMLQAEDTFLEQRIQVKNRSATITPIYLLLLFLFSIVALTLFFFRLQKETSLRVSTAKLVEVEAAARKQIEASELFNRTVLESSPHCLKVLDPEGRIQYMNFNGLCQMEIDDFSTVKNKNWWTLWGSENEALVKASIDKALKGETAHFTAFCPTAKGTPKWWDVVVSPVGKPGEPVQQIISVSRDITQQKEYETKIKQNEERFQLAFAAVDAVIYDWNIVEDKTMRSAELNNLLGFDNNEPGVATNTWYLTRLHPDDGANSVDIMKKAIQQGADRFEDEYRLLHKENYFIWVKDTGVFLKDARGENTRCVGSITNISTRKNAEEALRKSKERLQGGLKVANVALAEIDYNTGLVSLSPEATALYGLPANQLTVTREQMHNTFHPACKEKLELLIERCLNPDGDGLIETEHRILLPDGETRWLKVNKQVYFDRNVHPAKPSYSILAAQDITSKKEAELKLKISEEKYRGLFETMDQGFCIIELIFDSDNNPVDYLFMEANPMFEKQAGTANPVGKTIRALVPNMEERWFQMYGKVALTGEANHFIDRSEELSRWFEVYAFRLGDKGSKKVAVLFTDITDRKKAEQELKASEKRFRTFADSIQNLAWIANGDGWINWYNQRWYDYTGTTLEEMEGWRWEKVHHPDHIAKVVEFKKEAWKKDEAFELTFPLRRHDGEYRWFLTRAYPVKDAYGNIERWVGTNTDIHEQKTREQQKDEFISIASHEMKTPLTAAKGYIALLLRSLSEENQTALYATKANQALERLHNLITELLDVNKIQNGQLNYNISTFDFNKIVDETIENIQHSAKNHSIQKTGNCSQQITGDRGRLQQVLINLLSNAVKCSPKADKVLVKIEEQDSKIQVSVQDFGIGMSRQHLDKIFDRYYRVQEHSRRFQGLGIGLYISSNIIERHEGKIWAESEPEKGSTFYFTLPV